MTAEEHERFWAKVKITASCWEWTAGEIEGYGYFKLGPKTVKAHRLSYELLVGPISEGLVIDHLCRNRDCVNPDHLRACTHRENIMADGSEALAKENLNKTACVNGHSYTDENTYYRPSGGRRCRICDQIRHAQRLPERRAAYAARRQQTNTKETA